MCGSYIRSCTVVTRSSQSSEAAKIPGSNEWMSQVAGTTIWLLDSLDEREANFIALIRDNDKKYISAFDAVFESEGIHVIRTPFQAPNANSFSERWVRSARRVTR